MTCATDPPIEAEVKLTARAITARPVPAWSPVSDHRTVVDLGRGLFAVADAGGPQYGRWYAPYGVDPGLDALVRASAGPGALRGAIEAMDEAMRAVARALDDARDRARSPDPFEAAREAADALRPDRFAGYRSLAHAQASVAAVAIGPDGTGAVAAIGLARVYRRRAGALSVLAAGDGLGLAPAWFAPRMLGIEEPIEVETLPVDLAPGDDLVLCTSAVWHELEEAPLADLEGLVQLASRAGSDATIVVVRSS